MRHQPLSLLLAVLASLLCLQPAASDSEQSDAIKSASVITKSDIKAAIDHVSVVPRDNFEVFSTLLRTYKIVPSVDVEWPSATGPITYWSGRIVNLLAFQNIVMIVYNKETSFEELSALSGATRGYVKRFNILFNKMSGDNSSCYFERFTSRKRWMTKGVVVVDLTKSNFDQKFLLKNCASAGTDFINGLPFTSNRATLEQMPAPSVRAVLIDALYSCSFEGSTNIENPETSGDGLSERPSKLCVIKHLNDALDKTRE